MHPIVARLVLASTVLMFTSPVAALTISVAKIDKGAVQVKGKGAAPLALLTWEGQPVAQATKQGTFRFATPVLPQDCVGDLSDGFVTSPVVIESCGPASQIVQGPPGPKGDKGDPGAKGDKGDPGSPAVPPFPSADLLEATHACPGCSLIGVDLAGSTLNSALLTKANLTGANLKASDLTDADFSGAVLSGSDLSGADLSNAAMDTSVLLGVIYDGDTRCPDGSIVADGGSNSGTPYGLKIACSITRDTATVPLTFAYPGCSGCSNTCCDPIGHFADPTPSGSLVTAIRVSGYGIAGPAGTAEVNGFSIGPIAAGGNCVTLADIGPVIAEAVGGLGIPNWVYGGQNTITFHDLCLIRTTLVVTYIHQ